MPRGQPIHGAREWEIVAYPAHEGRTFCNPCKESEPCDPRYPWNGAVESHKTEQPCPNLIAGQTLSSRKVGDNNMIQKKWQPVGESNPSFQVENLAS